MRLNSLKKLFDSLLPKERRWFLTALILLGVAFIARLAIAVQDNSVIIPVSGGTYREGSVGQPIFINPVISANQPDVDIASLVYGHLSDFMENYEIQDEGRTYIILLKQGLKWSDDKPLTSNDVIFTLKLIQNPETNSPLFTAWQRVAAERLSEIKIRFSLPAPYAFFLDHLSRLTVIPEHIFGAVPVANLKLSDYNLKPVGNGPYHFGSMSKKDNGFITEYTLVLNDNYQGPKPNIEKFVFKFYENENDLLEAFRLHDVDGFGSLKPLVLDNRISKQTVIDKVPIRRYYAIFFNQNVNPILKNKNFRYALVEAIDKNKLIESVFDESASASVVDGPLASPDGSSSLSYDPIKAGDNLKNIDLKNLELNLISPNTDFLRKTADFVKNAWQNIGIPKVNVIELAPDDIVSQVIKPRNYEMLLFGQILEDPEDFFPFWHSSQRFYPGSNLAVYSNPLADKLIEKIRQELKSDFRPDELDNLEQIINSDAPALFLYTLPYTYVHSDKLRGFSAEGGSASGGQNQFMVNPADRFHNVADWYVLSARVIK